MTPDSTWLEAARMAVKDGHYNLACKLYERVITGTDGLDDLRTAYGADVIALAKSSVNEWRPEGKIRAIKALRELAPGTTLKGAKDIVERA